MSDQLKPDDPREGGVSADESRPSNAGHLVPAAPERAGGWNEEHMNLPSQPPRSESAPSVAELFDALRPLIARDAVTDVALRNVADGLRDADFWAPRSAPRSESAQEWDTLEAAMRDALTDKVDGVPTGWGLDWNDEFVVTPILGRIKPVILAALRSAPAPELTSFVCGKATEASPMETLCGLPVGHGGKCKPLNRVVPVRSAPASPEPTLPEPIGEVEGPTDDKPYRHFVRLREPRPDEVGCYLYALPSGAPAVREGANDA